MKEKKKSADGNAWVSHTYQLGSYTVLVESNNDFQKQLDANV